MAVPLLAALLLAPFVVRAPQDFAAGLASITEDELRAHATMLAAPELEGRDSPSDGLHRAAELLIAELQAAGVAGGMPDGSFRHGYTLERLAPVPEACALVRIGPEDEERAFELEREFVPYPRASGEGEGRLVFFGFGITESGERYDDLQGKNCNGEVVLILEGEPRSKKLFDGPVVTKVADAYRKAKALEDRGARAVLIARRPPEKPTLGADGKPMAPTELGFRHTFASWVGRENASDSAALGIPVLELSSAAASELLGEDAEELARAIEKSGKPKRREAEGVRVRVRAETHRGPVPIDNVVALVRGSDPALAAEHVVLGAHYDHIGVDPWGRVGCGADDNASGSAALLELAEAMTLARPKRSVLFVWFSAEEDGLYGSKAFVERPPVPVGAMVAMLNLDMIGRCDELEACVLGTKENPFLGDVLADAKKLAPTGLKRVLTGKGQEFWERSDQASFHAAKVPALFFFEGAIEAENPDYHTYDDTLDKLSIPKMARITRLVFNTAWLLCESEKRPPPPR
jgi:hypothetical protein